MSIPATQSTNPSTANVAARTASAAKPSTLNYDTFLRLLMAQMKNQDPTAPMKSTDYMGQLATFSQVEQSVNMNSKLDALLTSSSLSQASNLIGHTVTSADGSVTGTVTSARVTKDGLIVHLDSGQDVPYESGLTVS
ncbi:MULTISPECIES: flagellar hook assembly protein FlgD [Methylobacterium]|nr:MULTISPECIES: flagellar hook assembly protein FlgD [Methylobacterium]MBA9063334.1 flagellar basal-body rod modification protein FlgD [Methylobacterium fujisawaense]MDH3027863.1 flagellar hook assembly protein FlgD [Methylobacterium fujisawaense]RUP12727.1 MAG: flagellar hook assembly protein FlgD [Methylobacterium sp.]